jgi:hypothetical protein
VTTHRELLPPGGTRRERTAEQIAAAAPLGLDYPTTQVGVVGNITVSYDPALGAPGLALAQQMLGAVTGPYNDMQTFFGIAGGAVTVVIAPLSGHNDGSGGAYHYGCDFSSGGVLYLDATFASKTVNPLQLEIGLYVAELSESFMGPQNHGWGCGFSNGEGLSRFCAEQETAAGTLAAFTTGPAWAQAGFPDWISKTEQTDRDSVSTGCAIVYIYWLRFLGYTIPQIVQAGGATLAANYKSLTGQTTAYQDLRAALTGLTVTTDNPFGFRFVAAGDLEDGRIQLFGIEPNGQIVSRWKQTADPNSGWTAWSSFQTPSGGVSSICVGSLSDKRMQLFAINAQGQMISCWKATTNPNAAWTAWSAF